MRMFEAIVLGLLAFAFTGVRADFNYSVSDTSRIGYDASTPLTGDTASDPQDPSGGNLNGAAIGCLIQLIRTTDLVADPSLAFETGVSDDDTVVHQSFVGRLTWEDGYFFSSTYSTAMSGNYFIRAWNAPVASYDDWVNFKPDWSLPALRYVDSAVWQYSYVESVTPDHDFGGAGNANNIGMIADQVPTPVPEPASVGLFLLGGALAWRRRARRPAAA